MSRKRGIVQLTPRQKMAMVVSASLALHGLILTPLALNLNGATPERPDGLNQPPVFIDIQPRPQISATPRQKIGKASSPPLPANTPGETARESPEPSLPAGLSSDREPSPPVQAMDRGRWQVRPATPERPRNPVPRVGTFRCRAGPERLTPVEQAECDQVFADAAARSGPIAGTGNPARDAQFAALGNQALADYDRRRAPLKPNSRANPCPESPNPGDPCAFTIKGRLWSSRDGWLPDLPGRQ